MTARTLQPSEYEIQREVEALRDIRRRSAAPGALVIDPDLPNQSPPSSPTTNYRSTKPESTENGSQESDSGSSSNHSGEYATPNNPADDPFHLFWVPASLHPEIAPAEFRAFLKEHARNPASDGTDVERASSLASRSSLSRKRSMLSRQYQPKDGDESDQEIVPLKRNGSLSQQQPLPQLTISDLQKLEELAEEVAQSDDPSKIRSALRRSLSLQMSPSAVFDSDSDDADIPIIVPPPGQILRRAARTKIRKPGLPGEGAAHRFGASRRGGRRSSAGSEPEASSMPRRQALSDEGPHSSRPDSYTEDATSIFDAYVRDDVDETHPQPAQTEIQPSLLEALGPILAQPQPQHPVVPPSVPEPPRSPSPEAIIQEPPVQTPSPPPPQPFQPEPPSAIAQPIQRQLQSASPPPQPTSPPPHSHRKEKEKDKKSLFKWGSDKSSRKANKLEKEREKEKDGFFGSLFGGKKKQEESSPITNSAGREAAQALLGASKSSKNYVPPTSPGLAPGLNNFSRYPIHVERAIYRLSHIKLANPRRPLYEQVLISNLMFWYLGVINKAQTPATPTSVDADKEAQEKAEKEKEQKEKAEQERLERERQEKEQKERELEMARKKESGRRGSLTKSPVGGQPGGRRAEMPVKGPQYEMQQQNMQKEYSQGYNGQGPRNPNQPMMNGPPNGQNYHRNGSSQHQQQQYQQQQYPQQGAPQQYPPGSQYPPQQQYNNNPQQRGGPPQQMKPHGQDQYGYDNGGPQRGLPPGAMPPMGHGQPPPPRSPKADSFQQQQQQQQPQHGRVPFPQQGPPDGSSRPPGRSQSANAAPTGNTPHGMNGHLRKVNSAHAIAPHDPNRPQGRPRGLSEEDDTPLAVYQQQQRR